MLGGSSVVIHLLLFTGQNPVSDKPRFLPRRGVGSGIGLGEAGVRGVARELPLNLTFGIAGGRDT